MNSSLLFHEEIATDVINAFQEKLLATLADSSKGLAAFRFYLEEEQLLPSTVHNQLSFQGELGLIWQDGSISLHAITPTLLQQPELPLANWASYRFFHSDHRYLVSRNINYGSPRIFDRSLAEHISNHSLPDPPEGFTAAISMHKRTYADSRQVQIFEQETRLYLKPLFTNPFSYEFRRLPDKVAWEYMQTEALWFASFNPLPISFFTPTKQTICLLSPNALQDLLLPCFLSQDFQIAYQQKKSPSPRLKAWYDPKRRSGIGSHRFDRRGSPLVRFSLGEQNPYPLPDLPEQEIALGLVAQTNNRVSFRSWLLSQPEVLFIPTLEHPDDYHPLQTDQLFCPQATLFCYGKPVLQTALLLPVSCPRLISSKNLTSVDKALWDVPGLAFPALSLECTS
ncbi:hypothetical protein E1B06_20310 [Brevibacillus laterosporus]|uniref:hypothetical protein n=1 Tax=Brevibacillus laterosporus TaxID=1465 RepID=UPI002407440C|nr:hypothetical protein [Brevibacillus laterosporus]MDF9413994.1 hypothetical protein [Brevibacillus laterosporus]